MIDANRRSPSAEPKRAGRRFNPFCVQRVEPGAIAFQSGHDQPTLECLWDACRRLGCQGQIVGPHGSGKTTLLRHLARRAADAGVAVQILVAHQPGAIGRLVQAVVCRTCSLARPCGPFSPSRLPNQSDCTLGTAPTRLLAIDSAERLPWWLWAVVRWRLLHARSGLLVTTHRDLGLPTLHRRQVTFQQLRQIVDRLISGSPVQVSDALLADLHRQHADSVRDLLFDLYDRFEAGDLDTSADKSGG